LDSRRTTVRTTTNLYVRPDAGQLRRLAAEAAEGRLTLETRAVPLQDAPPIAQQVTAAGSGTRKYVLTPS
jgi:hypothetical protein